MNIVQDKKTKIDWSVAILLICLLVVITSFLVFMLWFDKAESQNTSCEVYKRLYNKLVIATNLCTERLELYENRNYTKLTPFEIYP